MIQSTYGRRYGKTVTTILWLLEDPENRKVAALNGQQKLEFLTAIARFPDPRIKEHSGEFWASRILVSDDM